MNTMIKTIAVLLFAGIFQSGFAATNIGGLTESDLNFCISKGKIVSQGSSVVAKVSLQMAQTVQAIVTTATGKPMLNTPVTLESGENQLRLHLGELQTGLYFLKIITAETTLTRTFYVM